MNTETLDLESEYTITGEQIERFQSDGYIKLKNVLSPRSLLTTKLRSQKPSTLLIRRLAK